jgi:hypothetical protein
MYALMAVLFFGCFIVSLTLGGDWKLPFAITSIVLLTIFGVVGTCNNQL